MSTTLFRDCLVVRDARSPFNPGRQDILVDGDKVAAIEPAGNLRGADEIIDADGKLAAAGMVNGHFHSWDHYIKGRVENLPMELMMPYLRPAKPLQLTDRQVYLRTMGGAIESFMQFDARPLVWRSVPADGDTPGSRVSHRTLLIGHYMYVLGGGSGSRSFNDLRRLDLYTMRWELMPTRGEARPPPPPATPPLHMGVLGMQLGRAARVCHACRAPATSRTRSSARHSSTWSRTWSSSAAATGGDPPTTCTPSTCTRCSGVGSRRKARRPRRASVTARRNWASRW